ncbi:choice-of-anchor J domain-containing protein [Nocardioides sp.]|uniref:choice-of-anchor J domain-containing protein n=1 Tax=Nocardioides sp. TaxID=35761 RepID=UPI0035B47619
MYRRMAGAVAVSLAAGAMAVTAQPAQAASATEGFDNVAALTTWKVVNLSEPTATTPKPSWSQGDASRFAAHAGATNSYAGVNYNSGGADVSTWLIMPQQTSLSSTDVLNFWSRSEGGNYPDRLEVRMSTNGSCSPGTTTDGVGDFTTLIGGINPGQAVNGYPTAWTQYNLPLTGLSTTNVSGCLAFRYFIKDTSKAGQYIGIDSLTFTDSASTACTTANATATSAQATATAASAQATSAKKVYKKAKKKLKKARKALKKATRSEVAKAEKKVKKKLKAKKKAKKKYKKAKTAFASAQTALATAQTGVTSSCP